MKVLIVARLFTGLAESVRDGSWAPRGVPAIYKLIEHLHADPSVELKTVLTVKDDLGAWSREDRRVTFREVGETLVFGSRGLSGLLREMAHMFQVLLLVVRWRPDVCYVTNANFIPASLVARFRLAPVVMRFLGLHPEQKRIARGESRLQGWFYRAPFARAVCSLDGSGGKAYLPDLLSAKVPITVLLNGVDRAPVDRERTAELRRVHGLGDRPVVLFVGRLESNKGILEFVAACRTVLDRTPGAMDVVVAGDGALLQEAEASAGSAGIRFLGAVDHGDVSALLSLADIYVSLNRYGSLSNANLEAARAGVCIVTLEPDYVEGTDVESLDVFPEGSVCRIPREGVVDALSATLRGLLDDPGRVEAYRARIRDVSETSFRTWNERMSDEIAILRAVAAEENRKVG